MIFCKINYVFGHSGTGHYRFFKSKGKWNTFSGFAADRHSLHEGYLQKGTIFSTNIVPKHSSFVRSIYKTEYAGIRGVRFHSSFEGICCNRDYAKAAREVLSSGCRRLQIAYPWGPSIREVFCYAKNRVVGMCDVFQCMNRRPALLKKESGLFDKKEPRSQ